jgi:diphthine synthase
MVGIGLNDEKDISVKGLEAVKKSSKVFLESYTSILQCKVSDLENFYGKKIIIADREMVEKKSDEILKEAKTNDVAFLVIGDVFSATTHTDLKLRATEKKIEVKVINNASVLNAVGITGLELYKFGKTTSIPFPEKGFEPETPYDSMIYNRNLHTLILLDLRPLEGRFMTVNEAITYMLIIEEKRQEYAFTKDTKCIGIARLGSNEPVIKYGKAKDLMKEDFGKAPHCLIVPGKLHFVEEEALEKFKI